ncbi:MAG: hypothetical protein AAF697_09045 [Pseudomonadota bacterium]
MDDLAPRIDASSDLARGLVRFSAGGLFDEDELQAGAAKIGAAAAPFVSAKRPWSVLADYTDAIVQPRHLTDTISESFEMARKMGLQRVAVLNAPALVQMQYKRLVGTVEIGFFESKIDAMAWLDDEQDAASASA